MSAASDPATFVAELRAAGYRVVLSTPGTCFGPGDEQATYFIAPADGQGFGDAYSEVMLKWHEAMVNYPNHVGAVVAHLSAAWEAGRDPRRRHHAETRGPTLEPRGGGPRSLRSKCLNSQQCTYDGP